MATKRKKSNARRSGAAPRKRSAPPKPAYNAAARLIGGMVCLLLALCVLVSYFRVDALFLTFFAKLLKGLFGYGYYLAMVALGAVGIIQIGHGGRPVILRTVCALLSVPLLGSLLHLLLSHTAYTPGVEMIKALWADGQAVIGGGVVSGTVAVGLKAVFGKAISAIVLIVLLLGALMGAGHVTPAQVVGAIKERPRYDEDDEDTLPDPIPVSPRQRAIETGPRRPRRPVIDFPLDGEEPLTAPEEKADVVMGLEPPEKKSFFARKSEEVRTPAEVLEPARPEDKPAAEEKQSRRRKEISSEDVTEIGRASCRERVFDIV